MSQLDFLARMEACSRERLLRLRREEPQAALRRRARSMPAPRALMLPSQGFDVIAEIKRRSPSAGELASRAPALAAPEARARAYARAGAAAISVVTEPSAFGGDLSVLRAASDAVSVPVMRKDFLIDPHQVFEARAHGADGVLLVVRILRGPLLGEMVEAAAEARVFAVLEVFSAQDVARSTPLARRPGRMRLLGVNARDLATLDVQPGRLEAMAHLIPDGAVAVAESGLREPADVGRCAAAGYRLALVGGALMESADPASLLRAMVAAGRASRAAAAGEAGCACG